MTENQNAKANGLRLNELQSEHFQTSNIFKLIFIIYLILVQVRYIQSTSATSGQGLYEGLDWLSNNISATKKWWK